MTPLKAGKVCGDCGHWNGGECRRYPPQVVPTPSDNQHPIAYWPAEWFPTRSATEAACGEFA